MFIEGHAALRFQHVILRTASYAIDTLYFFTIFATLPSIRHAAALRQRVVTMPLSLFAFAYADVASRLRHAFRTAADAFLHTLAFAATLALYFHASAFFRHYAFAAAAAFR